MQQRVSRLRVELATGPVPTILTRIVQDDRSHARFLNMLAHLEYIGVRKMLKARHAESMDLDGLHHVLEEASHAVRLKRAATEFGKKAGASVESFAPADCLGGPAGARYFQAVDQACAAVLADLEEEQRTQVNYVLTSAVIEIRADAFYPLYEEALRRADVSFSMRGILRDEERHLAEMDGMLTQLLPDAEARLDQALEAEQHAFDLWLATIDAEVRGWIPDTAFADQAN